MSLEEYYEYNDDKCKQDKLGRYEYATKQMLKDPDSYKRLGYEFNDDYVLEIIYSATNTFGARIKEVVRIHFDSDWCGEVLKIEKP